MSTIEPRQKLWTRREYRLAIDAGIFAGQNVELMEGRILEMSPMNPRRAVAVQLVASALMNALEDGYSVRVQLPMALGEESEPQPDVAVVIGQPRDYVTQHPTCAKLVIEISDSSVIYDRTEKLSLYASSGVPEYWIVNLADECLELYSQPCGHEYRRVHAFSKQETVPASLPRTQSVAVADLLP
ncbi:MAG: Uma2 family endonuclease [Planctomycetales bacterium]|nr:Uma2 family endonuclease [Planctomycetales bacterium]